MTGRNSALTKLLHHPAVPGLLLVVAMVAALVTANTATGWYDSLLLTGATVGVGEWEIQKPLLLWINDGLMAVFFLLVGLELKREVLFGELSSVRKVVLPIFAAVGGIAAPAVVYVIINWGDPVALNGWAIPAATDIAFALGILALLGSKAPVGLKILLTSVAVIDDLAAIVIIALFYTDQLSTESLLSALVVLFVLAMLNRFRVKSITPYVLLGIVLWVAVLKSGVHATLAGVALALFIPAGKESDHKQSPAHMMEHYLHPWVIFGILPVFAFANSGISLAGMSPSILLNTIPLGIALGLFLGKPIGILLTSLVAVKFCNAHLPKGVNWGHLAGMSMLCGIGFTMSLFIGSLAFEATGGPDYAILDRVGILAGSLLSAIAGVITLLLAARSCEKRVTEEVQLPQEESREGMAP